MLSKFIFSILLSFIISVVISYFNINNINIANAETLNQELLQKFLQGTITWTADFEQITILDSAKKGDSNIKKTQGKVYLLRPGKFKWQIDKPYTQIIIGNGEKIWLDDPDLQQTTIKKSSAILEASPMALLAGKNNINNDFKIEKLSTITENSIKNNLKNSQQISNKISNIIFLRLTPKKESSFIEIILGLDNANGEPIIMQLVDNLNQSNQIIFFNSQKNIKLPQEMFNFIIPKDRDIIEN